MIIEVNLVLRKQHDAFFKILKDFMIVVSALLLILLFLHYLYQFHAFFSIDVNDWDEYVQETKVHEGGKYYVVK